MNKSKANLMILAATVFWGMSYTLTKIGLGSFGVFNLIAIRFLAGFAVSALILRRYIELNRKTLLYSWGLGVLLFMAFATMTFALKHTTASNVGFLVGSLVIMIPILSFFIFKKKSFIKKTNNFLLYILFFMIEPKGSTRGSLSPKLMTSENIKVKIILSFVTIIRLNLV